MALQGTPLCLLVTIACGLQYLLYGYDQGFMSGVLIAEDFLAVMGHPDTFLQGLMASLYEVGAFFGCAVSMLFSQKLGRRYPIMIGTVFVVLGAVIQAAAYGRAQFLAGRVVSGLGTGLNTSIIPIWQAETLPARKRERFGTLQYLLVCTGITVSYWMNYALSYAGGQFEWRFAIAAQVVFAIGLFIIIPFMPESPRWLIMQDRNAEAITIVKRMHGVTDDEDEEVQTELRLIHQALELELMGGTNGFWDLFKMGDTQILRRLLLGWWMMAMVMWSGVCSIGYYISYLFETSVGLSHDLSLLLSGFNGLWYLVSAIIPFFVLHRIGKRWALIIGAVGMGFCFLVMALTVRYGGFGASIVCVIAFFLYYTFFSLGWLAIPWLYCAEILPLHLRSIGNSVTTSSNWLNNFISVLVTPALMGNLGWKGYLLFMVCNFAFAIIVYVFYPETTGRRLEEIDAIFYRTSPIVCGTKWTKKGHFETEDIDRAILNAGVGKVGAAGDYMGDAEHRDYVDSGNGETQA